jgi:glucose-6-phosphate isomerase
LWENPALLLAAMLYLAETRASTHTVVLMPYSDRLRDLARWFAQLWAESLGKAVDLDGRVRASGTTPQAAVGISDQHALLHDILMVGGAIGKLRKPCRFPSGKLSEFVRSL